MPFGLFKTEWEKRPNDPTTYPSLCQQFINDYRILWEEEISRLISLNIPLPTKTKDFVTYYTEKWDHSGQVSIYRRRMELTPPQFSFPPHIVFHVRPKTHIKNYSVGDHIEYCFFAPETEDINEANEILTAVRAALEGKRLISVFEKYPIRFFNRDPYQYFKNTDKPYTYHHSNNTKRDDWYEHELKPIKWIELREGEWFSVDELRTAKLRMQILRICGVSLLPGGRLSDVLLLDISIRVVQGVSDDYINETPVPNFDLKQERITLKILPDLAARFALAEQFLDRLHHLANPISFSIVAEKDTIYFQLACAPGDRAEIERQIEVHYPGFTVLEHTPLPPEATPNRIIANPYYAHLSIKTLKDFSPDPYSLLFSAYSKLSPNDNAIVRIHFVPITNETIGMIMDEINQVGGYFQPHLTAPRDERLRVLEKKLPWWMVQITLESSNPAVPEKLQDGFLQHYKTPGEPLYTTTNQASGTFGMVSTAELAALVHFPDKSIQCDLLETASMKNKLPPDLYTKEGVIIGQSSARGLTKTVTIPNSVRDRHTYVVGKSGTGKSTLLFNCIRQDIEAGHGVAVIDPHGDLVEEVLNHIPEHRVEDTIYFNAADKEHPIGLNILNAQDEDEIGLLADDLLITFKRLSESWGERMENILRYSFHTLLRTEDATFLDIKTILQNSDFRQQAAAQVKNRMLQDFWQLEYPNYPKDAAQPILNRMSKFSLSPTLAGILAQPDSSLNFFDVIQNKKILLVNISKGQIGEDTAQLLGSLIVSQLQLAIMRRAALPKESRDPYYLYVDEFQNFTTSAFEKILSEARKYKLCLTLAHQYISQLDERTKNAILANVGTIIMFQSYPADAQALRPELGQYEPSDVTNLNTAAHEALCKPSTQSKDTFLFQTLAPPQKPPSFAREIIEQTRENYSTTPVEYNAPRVAYTPPPQTDDDGIPVPRPARALPKEFANTGDRILYFVNQAEWLATPQLHQLCYSHISEGARASNASRDLKALVEAKRIKFQNFGKSKIYYTGRQVNPTTHNLAIRDLFAKIVASGYEVAEVNFFPQLPGLTADLAISFLNDDGTQTKSFWEYDAGTEGIAELLKKVSRYSAVGRGSLAVFVFSTRERLLQFQKAAGATRIVGAVINEFMTLDDPAFLQLQGGEAASEASELFGSNIKLDK